MIIVISGGNTLQKEFQRQRLIHISAIIFLLLTAQSMVLELLLDLALRENKIKQRQC